MMIKEFPAEVFLRRIYCNKCGCRIDEYKNTTNLLDIFFIDGHPKPQYEYNCKNCGNIQIESEYPTFIVKGTADEKVEVE